MSGEPFTLDTNILVYSVDRKAGDRHEMAKEVMQQVARAPCSLMLQAVSEFYAVVTRKGMMPPSAAAGLADAMLTLFRTVPASAAAVRNALASAASGHASYWDALLVFTAAEAGCSAILTEDLTDGTALFGVRIVNPFGAGGLTPAAQALLVGEGAPPFG